jgi:hypothetical protein
MVFLNSPCRETPKNLIKKNVTKTKSHGGWVGLRFSKCTGGSVDFFLAAPRRLARRALPAARRLPCRRLVGRSLPRSWADGGWMEWEHNSYAEAQYLPQFTDDFEHGFKAHYHCFEVHFVYTFWLLYTLRHGWHRGSRACLCSCSFCFLSQAAISVFNWLLMAAPRVLLAPGPLLLPTAARRPLLVIPPPPRRPCGRGPGHGTSCIVRRASGR